MLPGTTYPPPGSLLESPARAAEAVPTMRAATRAILVLVNIWVSPVLIVAYALKIGGPPAGTIKLPFSELNSILGQALWRSGGSFCPARAAFGPMLPQAHRAGGELRSHDPGKRHDLGCRCS